MGQSSESEIARNSSPSSTVTRPSAPDGRRARQQDLLLERPARQVERAQGTVKLDQIRGTLGRKIESRRRPVQGRAPPRMLPRPPRSSIGPPSPAMRAPRSPARPAARTKYIAEDEMAASRNTQPDAAAKAAEAHTRKSSACCPPRRALHRQKITHLGRRHLPHAGTAISTKGSRASGASFFTSGSTARIRAPRPDEHTGRATKAAAGTQPLPGRATCRKLWLAP